MNHKHMSFGILSVSILIALTVLKTIIVPRWHTYCVNQQELLRYESLTSAVSNYDNLRTELSRTQNQLQNKLRALSSGLGNENDLSALLQMLIGKAKEADIRFVRMEPQQQSTSADFIRYPVLLDLTTSYNSLGKFIASLEASPQAVRVNRLALTASSTTTVGVRLLVTCYLHVGS